MELAPRDYDPAIVLWAWCRLLDTDTMPARRVVIRFDLRDRPKERFWLLLDRPEAEVCVTNPGLDEDLIVVTDSRTLTMVHMGRLPLGEAIRGGAVGDRAGRRSRPCRSRPRTAEPRRFPMSDLPRWTARHPWSRCLNPATAANSRKRVPHFGLRQPLALPSM
jgi:hypothetical protein